MSMRIDFKKEYTRDEVLDLIEMRVEADCNMKRLAEHRDCNYCHLSFDCRYYKRQTGDTLCDYHDSLKKEDK